MQIKPWRLKPIVPGCAVPDVGFDTVGSVVSSCRQGDQPATSSSTELHVADIAETLVAIASSSVGHGGLLQVMHTYYKDLDVRGLCMLDWELEDFTLPIKARDCSECSKCSHHTFRCASRHLGFRLQGHGP